MLAGLRFVLVFLFLSFAQLGQPAPVNYFPINSQLPPVARISQPFSYVFSPQTFSSPFPITYTLANAPEWLSIDSGSRRLFGTPIDEDVPSGDVVGIPIELVAEDMEGVATANSTLVVSRNPAPSIHIPLDDQISKFGQYSAPSSLLLSPSKDFSFAFDPNTFGQDGGSGLSYYAVSGDNAPLPSWLRFDSENMSFSGETPSFESLVQPPQIFDVQLVASDIVGFAAVSVGFSVVVGSHKLTTDEPLVVLNATHDVLFRYRDLPKTVKLDGKPIVADDIESIDAHDLSDWLSLDSKTWELSGTPDSTAESSNITISVVDIFSDQLNITLEINIDTHMWRSLPSFLNVSSGERFSFDLKPHLFNPSDVDLDIVSQPHAHWLRLDTSALVLSGAAPESETASSIKVDLRAKSKRTRHTDSQALTIGIRPSPSKTKTTSTVASPPASPTSSAPPDSKSSKPSLITTVLLATLLPLFIIPFILILYCCCWRPHRQRRELKKNTFDVSAPVPGTFAHHNTGSAEGGLLRDMYDIGLIASKMATQNSESAPTTSSNLKEPRHSPDLNVNRHAGPRVTELHSGTLRTFSDPALRETSDSWLEGQVPPPRPKRPEEADGQSFQSLLSDTSIGDGDYHIEGATPALVISKVQQDNAAPAVSKDQNEPSKDKIGLDVPINPEPFSIQNTPEIAYTAGSKYSPEDDWFSDISGVYASDTPPLRPLTTIRQSPESTGLRGVGKRLSNARRRSRLTDDTKRNSGTSSSTLQTTRTSILTSSATVENPSTATISRPTIIHIPSRPGEVRQISRRVNESSPLFGGRSVVRSPRNLETLADSSAASSLDIPFPPPVIRDTAPGSRDSDTSRDRLARDSLGIAYKDLVKPGQRESLKSVVTTPKTPAPQRDPKWSDRQSKDLLSPDQWPQPQMSERVKPSSSRASQAPRGTPVTEPPMTPKGKGKGKDITSGRRRSSRGTTRTPSSATSTPPTSTKKQQPSQDERPRMSRLREQRAIDDFKTMLSNTTPPPAEISAPLQHSGNRSNSRPPIPPLPPSTLPPPRPLPETPTRQPLRDLGLAPRSNASNRSFKTVRSEFVDTDDDEWEDVRPSPSPGGALFGSSNGSFPVYI